MFTTLDLRSFTLTGLYKALISKLLNSKKISSISSCNIGKDASKLSTTLGKLYHLNSMSLNLNDSDEANRLFVTIIKRVLDQLISILFLKDH